MLGEFLLIIEDFVTNVAVPEGMRRSRLLVLPAEEGGALADDRTEAGTRLFDRQKISASRAGAVIILEGTCSFRDRGRSGGRRVGKESVSTCRLRWSRNKYKKKKRHNVKKE